MQRPVRALVLLTLLTSSGAGCLSPVSTTKVAEPLDNRRSELSVDRDVGFGELPNIEHPQRRAQVNIIAKIPEVPEKITVIRLRNGSPNDTELRNIAAAVGIPGSTVSDQPTRSTLELSWTDNLGYRWDYRTNERMLEFTLEKYPPSPLTVPTLPSNEGIINLANSFLLARAIDPQSYRNAVVDPDWNNWWLRAKAAGLCMTTRSLSDVRAIASSASLVAGGPPSLPSAKDSTCVSPEFPSKAVVRYRAFVDERDVLLADGKFVNGIELIVDVTKKVILGGRIMLFTDADRSDYPGLSAADAVSLLKNGGITPITGDVSITSIDFASYRIDTIVDNVRTSYLIPSLIGTGMRTLPNGSTESIRIVAPLLKQ